MLFLSDVSVEAVNESTQTVGVVSMIAVISFIFVGISNGFLAKVGERLYQKVIKCFSSTPKEKNVPEPEPMITPEPVPVKQPKALPPDHYPTKLPIAVDERYFLSREKEVQELKNWLHEGKQPIITGIGGMGKTTLARKLFSEVEREYDCACWVDFSGDMETSLLNAFELFRDEENAERRLDLILAFLKDPRPKLLVVDNVDKPKDNSRLLRELSALRQVQLVLTSRMVELSPYTPYPLNFLPERSASSSFTATASITKAARMKPSSTWSKW